MIIKTISYTKVFPLAAYVNEKIGVEVEVDESESYEKQFQEIKALVNSWGSNMPIQLTDAETVKWDIAYRSSTPMTGTISHVQPPVRNLAAERLEILIDDSKTVHEVKQYQEEAMRLGIMEYWRTKFKNLKQ